MHILLIEDDVMLCELVRRNLIAAGYAADAARTIKDAEEFLTVAAFDVLLLDLTLPDGDGIDLLRKLRREGNTVPIVAVTARGNVGDRIDGFNLGSDDYLVKPFATEELIARIRAVLRRPVEALGQRLALANVEFDPASGTVVVGGGTLMVPRKEIAILEILMRRAGGVVARTALEQSIYALAEEISSNAMDANISRLRRRLAEAGAKVSIHAIRGVGYMIRQSLDDVLSGHDA